MAPSRRVHQFHSLKAHGYCNSSFISLSSISRIKILTYLNWGFLGAAIFDCIIRSCDLFYWFIRTCLGPTVVPAAITSLELFCVLTMCYFSEKVINQAQTIIGGSLYLSCFGKLFTSILNNRLNNYLENMNIIAEEQN